MAMPKRVLAAQIMHETNTFSRLATDLAAFTRREFHRDNAIPTTYRGTRSAFGATFEAAERYGWTLIHPVAANANPSGLVTRAAFEALAEMVVTAARDAAPIDGVLLHLHGAMVSEAAEDGEGELLRRLRQVIGGAVPVVATLDLHANVSQAMAALSNALIAFRTYPHIDMYERAWQGAALLERAMRGEIRPRNLIARRPTIRGLNYGRTQSGPMAELLARGDALEAAGEALVVSVCAGFTRADIRDVGPSVTVTIDERAPGAAAAGQAIAEAFMDHVWQTRDFDDGRYLTIPEAIARARLGRPGDRPLVMADFTDNPGGGGYGDATALLGAMIEAELPQAVLHAICDPAAVEAGGIAGIGRTATLTLGGRTDPTMGGGPLTLTGEVTCLTNGRFIAHGPMGGGVARDYGPSMVFRVGAIDIVVITNNGQANDLGQLTSLGIDPARYRTVAVKSAHHFRAAFEPLAREVVMVDTGALCGDRITPELFTRAPRPIWPLDAIEPG